MASDTVDGVETGYEQVVDNMACLFIAIVASHALKAATSVEYRDRLERRAELREEYSAPEWIPYSVRPYYNVVGWKARIALLIGDLHFKSPIRWYGRPGLEGLIKWSTSVDVATRWEVHEDWEVAADGE